MIFAGCDIGSLTAEAVILKTDNGSINSEVLSVEIMRVRSSPELSATEVMQKALDGADLCYEDIDVCCSTGYGREEIPFADFNKSEISCHGKGVNFIDTSIAAIIDIGGQDCKAIRIDENGNLLNFKMNNRCAAGTGRFLEVSAEILGISVEQLGSLSLKSRRDITITGQCSIFAEMELTNQLNKGKKVADLASGINKAMALRVSTLAMKVVNGLATCITGGVSKNIGVTKNLEKIMGMKFMKIDFDQQAAGALGAAVFAKEYYDKNNSKR